MLKDIFELFRRESQLSQAFERSYEMLREDRQMLEEAIQSLRSREDARLNIDIYAKDQMINAYEREVRRKVFAHLTISGERDVNASLVLVSVVIDIERIGDFTKNIVELALHHPKRLVGGPFDEDMTKIETLVKTMFDRLIEALPDNDEVKARSVMAEHWWIARRADDIIRELIEKDDVIATSGDAVTCALYLRYLKRVSAHLMNIASSVVNPFDRIGFRGRKGVVDDE